MSRTVAETTIAEAVPERSFVRLPAYFGLCGGFQNAGFQIGRSLHFNAGSDGVEGCFRLAVEFGAGGTAFRGVPTFAANLCRDIVIEQQFIRFSKIGAFHGG